MDYWHSLDLFEHDDWDAFLAHEECPRRIHLFTTKAESGLWETEFRDGDGLLFGNEGSGLPQEIHAWAGERRIKIPQFSAKLRSLNLATAAAVVVYEALRQTRQ
jgi:tRNA (cytidine/uridine-2'-O-)-methyltransferase